MVSELGCGLAPTLRKAHTPTSSLAPLVFCSALSPRSQRCRRELLFLLGTHILRWGLLKSHSAANGQRQSCCCAQGQGQGGISASSKGNAGCLRCQHNPAPPSHSSPPLAAAPLLSSFLGISISIRKIKIKIFNSIY